MAPRRDPARHPSAGLGTLPAAVALVAAALVGLLTGVGTAGASPLPAAVARYGPLTPALTLGVSASCGSVVVSGTGTPGDTIQITVNGSLVATTIVGANGTYSVEIHLACGTTNVIEARDAATGQTASATVSSPAASPVTTHPTGSLPVTGAAVEKDATVAAVAIGVGGVLVLAARRRRREPTTTR